MLKNADGAQETENTGQITCEETSRTDHTDPQWGSSNTLSPAASSTSGPSQHLHGSSSDIRQSPLSRLPSPPANPSRYKTPTTRTSLHSNSTLVVDGVPKQNHNTPRSPNRGAVGAPDPYDMSAVDELVEGMKTTEYGREGGTRTAGTRARQHDRHDRKKSVDVTQRSPRNRDDKSIHEGQPPPSSASTRSHRPRHHRRYSDDDDDDDPEALLPGSDEKYKMAHTLSPFWRSKSGIAIIVCILLILIGVAIGGAVGGKYATETATRKVKIDGARNGANALKAEVMNLLGVAADGPGAL